MKLNKTLVTTGILSGIAVASIAGIGAVHAASSTSGETSLISRLAQKFNLSESDVKSVFDEDKAARDAERDAGFSEDLQDQVDAGKITAEQKTLIENKRKELESAREAERTELESWATANNIDMKYLFGGRHGQSADRLQDAVDDGDITAEQKTLIEAKQSELETKRQTARDELEKWATANNIDLDTFHLGFGGPGPRF